MTRDLGWSEDTTYRYKRAFAAMDMVTRLRVTAWAAAELYNDLADTRLNVTEHAE
jgi:hypothetical protein